MIGAGISGLTAGKALSDMGARYTCFEASDDIGGNWYFRNPNGRSSAYRSLHIDISKPSISLRDYPIPDHYPDFPHHTEIREYLNSYAAEFDLRPNICFNTSVEHAERQPDGAWRITLEGGGVEQFDALIVCNGHHWDPLHPDPKFDGTFDGEQIHAHHYIDPTEPLDLRGKRVLVVGIGNSAVDIASELSRKGVAERVCISTRSGAWVIPKYIFGRPADQLTKTNPYIPLAWQRRVARLLPLIVSGRPERFGLPTPNHHFLDAHPTVSSELLLRLGSGDAEAKPNVAELLGNRVRFDDGTIEHVDAIIYATGYQVSFPFFDEDFISAPGNVLPLYKRIFKPGIDNLAFIGLAQVLPTGFPFAETQSKLVAEWLAGNWALPPRDDMEAEIADDEQRFAGHYKRSPRHTMQTDLYIYEHDLRWKVLPEGRKRARSSQHARAGVPQGMSGRTIIVTGAARGIGAATAVRLHARGANVALLDVDAEPLEALADKLGDRAAWFKTDVTDGAALERAVAETVDKFGGIDIAIANAGIGHVGTLAGSPPDEIERTIQINLLGTWRTDRAVIDQIVERRGYLLNVASLAAAMHTPANGAYAASKAGIEALTDALRVELAPTGVAVGCAYFGYIDTELERESVAHPAIQSMQRMMPRFASRAAPVAAAVDAIEDAVTNRRARVWAPRYVGAALVMRGVLQPLSEWRARRDSTLSEQLTQFHNHPGRARSANP